MKKETKRKTSSKSSNKSNSTCEQKNIKQRITKKNIKNG